MQTLALGWTMAGSDGLGKLTGNDTGVRYNIGVLYESMRRPASVSITNRACTTI